MTNERYITLIKCNIIVKICSDISAFLFFAVLKSYWILTPKTEVHTKPTSITTFPDLYFNSNTNKPDTSLASLTCWPVWWRLRARPACGWSAARWSATATRQSRRRSRQGRSSSAELWGTTSSNVPAPSGNRHCRSYKRVRLWRKPPGGHEKQKSHTGDDCDSYIMLVWSGLMGDSRKWRWWLDRSKGVRRTTREEEVKEAVGNSESWCRFLLLLLFLLSPQLAASCQLCFLCFISLSPTCQKQQQLQPELDADWQKLQTTSITEAASWAEKRKRYLHRDSLSLSLSSPPPFYRRTTAK